MPVFTDQRSTPQRAQFDADCTLNRIAVVPVRGLVWVPQDPLAPIVARGDTRLAPIDYRQESPAVSAVKALAQSLQASAA